ncbi:MAG: hypothetical protein IT386_07510 [Deltaproteobacteria bacterium]|nr:hypothetical protein [Deltaproteobacteria bacterium]
MLRLVAVLGALLLSSSPALAEGETLDLAQSTCADLSGNSAARRFFVIWFDGYLAGKRGVTVSDGKRMQARLDRVLEACQSDMSQKILPLMEKQK